MNLKATLSALLLAGLAVPSAFASDGTITFAGEITNISCSVSGEGGVGENFTVNLNGVDGSKFTGIGSRVGDATFRGRWENGETDAIHPLTVGRRDSGFGVQLFIEDANGVSRAMPHDYTQHFSEGEPLRSDQDVVRYRIVRTAGPVSFGRVDPGRIAQSNVNGTNGSLIVFRSMDIYDLIFRRPACSISAETLNQTVDMGSHSIADFNNAERATPWRHFRLTVSECREPVGLVARFTFGTASDADPEAKDLFSMPAGGPTHVGLEIANEAKRTIEPGVPYDANALATGKDFTFNVRLRESRYAVGGGKFTRPVTVRVDFM